MRLLLLSLGLFLSLILLPQTASASSGLQRAFRSARGGYAMRRRVPRPNIRRYRAPRRHAGVRGRYRGNRYAANGGRSRIAERSLRRGLSAVKGWNALRMLRR
ncbi:MAG: hypothetical protein R3B54_12265 [Bdellovibrionota bacterium]